MKHVFSFFHFDINDLVKMKIRSIVGWIIILMMFCFGQDPSPVELPDTPFIGQAALSLLP
jgi:hypothetical protein